jgi:SAM-dependent methyltransferase
VTSRRVRLRYATKADHELLWSWYDEPVDGSRPVGERLSKDAHHARFMADRRDPDRLLFVVQSDGEDVGWLRFEREKSDARLDLHLAPPHRTGETRRLAIESALERVRLEWAPERVLVARRENDDGWAALFETCGFATVPDDASPGQVLAKRVFPPTPEDIQRFKATAWDDAKTAALYEELVYARHGVMRVKHRVELGYVLRHATGRVLDAGAGTARFALALQKAGHEPVALDTSAAMLGIAVEKSGGSLPAVVADIMSVPFPDSCFDSVVSITVIEHLPRYRKAVAELARVLKPGGKIVFQLRSAEHAKKAALERPVKPAEFLVELTGAEVDDLLAATGLERVGVAPYGLFHGNQVAQRVFGRAYRVFLKVVNAASRLPLADRVFAALEMAILGRAPLWACNGLIVVARKCH